MPQRGHTTGAHNKQRWSQGGTKRRKNFIEIDFSNFESFAEKLDNLNADLKKIFGDAMENAAETVQDDTTEAVWAANLPAKGKYSGGDTAESIIRNLSVKWSGSIGEIGLGFDKTKAGAGGFLITGTPYMHPDEALVDIYTNKGYTRKIVEQITEELQEALDDLGG